MFIMKTLNVLNQNKGTNKKIIHYKWSCHTFHTNTSF